MSSELAAISTPPGFTSRNTLATNVAAEYSEHLDELLGVGTDLVHQPVADDEVLDDVAPEQLESSDSTSPRATAASRAWRSARSPMSISVSSTPVVPEVVPIASRTGMAAPQAMLVHLVASAPVPICRPAIPDVIAARLRKATASSDWMKVLA
ncbi:hypothetical protein HGA11_30190 [Mycolicibacterium septicum DSM 44393]|uniref:Uncharacterized protein n=1 Tax=Mycolicibacterium septicum DSM 44393 TaxID=1341646 RepID=A0A7X6RZ69_9MYCO|nr:hypothetical protein [Mycolicibacterium septicum]NKZ15249.1 hypothetical protein [Mycolicibacterium septicum DSM 44393]